MTALPENVKPDLNSKPFVHLHVHTEFSLLDGLSKIDKLVARAKAQGMTSLAITDHGTMHGVMQFYRACRTAEIKPIIGMESYLAKRDRTIHDQTEKQPYHLLLLAKNQAGYLNLLKLASEAQLTGFYGKPRVDKDLLAKYSDGIICTSGCLAAEVPRLFAEDRELDARRLIGEYQDIFGAENFFLELQAHDIPELRTLNEWLIRYRGGANVRLLATNDVHYVMADDFDAHDTLLCIQTGARKDDVKRMRMTDPSYHLRSSDEMWDLFEDVAPEALTNTQLVAEMCELDLESKGYHLPIFPVPEVHTPGSYLRQLALRGARWRYGDDADSEVVRTRIEYELSIISEMGFETYFLIVWDLCQYASNAGIWWNVRGSGAGSAVAYSLGITSIDPIRNNLIFERFLNPGRITMPDIDMDFPDDQRSRMIDYAVRKYGEDKVAAIITFGTLKARAAIKDVARTLAYPLERANALTQMVPNIPSHPVTLAQCLSDDPEYMVADLKNAYAADQETQNVLDTAIRVEGVARSAGTHAAGVIIGDQPLVKYLPLHRPTSNANEAVPIKRVTQFPMEICESIGLLKIDFLGLSTLSVMRRACELIARYRGIHYDLGNIPYRPVSDDPTTSKMVEESFKLIGSGEVTGVFQLESQGMRRMLVEMQPRTFEHIVAAISLYRPGPLQFIPLFNKRLHGEDPVEYLHPKLEPILAETYGIIAYQEQLMRIGSDLFGYSLGDADLMRRAVSKKKAKDLAKHKEVFIAKGPENGVPADVAEKIFDQVEFFAAYGFNKSHAADYAVITCQTAFLKCHYAPEYYTALLTVQRDKIEDVTLFTADCRRLGIPILPPNINFSELDFTIEEKDGKRGIRFGLGAIKGVGDKVSEMIIAERNAFGAYISLSDFSSRLDLGALGGKRPLEALTKVGVFDIFGERHLILAALDRMTGISKAQHHARKTGQALMFDSATDDSQSDAELLKGLPNVQMVTQREKLDWEKELIGLYVSSHPLDPFMALVQDLPNITYSSQMKEDAETIHDHPVTLLGMATSIRRVVTKKNDTMAIVTVDDLFGSFDAVFFPRTWARFAETIKENEPYIFRGKADTKRGNPQVLVDSITQEFGLSSSADDDPYFYDRNSPGFASNPANSALSVSADLSLAHAAYDSPLEAGQLSGGPGQNHNGNGHTPENGNGATSMVSVAPPLVTAWDNNDDEDRPPPPRQLLVSFAPFSHGKREIWQRRIERIYLGLSELPGNDELTFRIPDPDNGTSQLMTFGIGIDFELAVGYLDHMKDADKAEISWTDLKD